MKRLLIGVLVLVAVFLVIVAMGPSTYHVERSASIAAPPQTVYAEIADFRRWEGWSPWEKLDPAMKKEFGGAESGVGATYSWVGNKDVGEGRMTITEDQPVSRVGIRLEFLKPFPATSQCAFKLAPEGDGTRVRWTMDGDLNFISKVMCVFVSMDKMLGGDFEKGLAGLRSVAEARPPAAADSTAAPGA